MHAVAIGYTYNKNYLNWNCLSTAVPGPHPLMLAMVTTVNLGQEVLMLLGCPANNTCCSNINQPWFHHQLSETTQDDIEVRFFSFCNEATIVDIHPVRMIMHV